MGNEAKIHDGMLCDATAKGKKRKLFPNFMKDQLAGNLEIKLQK